MMNLMVFRERDSSRWTDKSTNLLITQEGVIHEIKRLVFVVVALGSLIFWMPDANAGYWINGQYIAKGVECDGTAQVKNTDKNQVSLACTIAPPANQPFDVLLFCQNHGGHIGTGRVFSQ